MAAIYVGTQEVAAEAAALNDGTSLNCSSVEVQNNTDSNGDVLIGVEDGQYRILAPGAAQRFPADNVVNIYVKLSSADTATINWVAIGR